MLSTPRLSLSRPTPDDVDAIFAIHRDPAALVHNPSDAIATRAQAQELYQRWDAHWTGNGVGYWVVRYAGDDTVLGFCGLKLMRLRSEPVLNLFYRFDPAAWGHGVASEAALAVVGWAALNRPDALVIARVRPANVASHRVAGNAGLARAPHLDEAGEDGDDWIYTSG